VHRASASCQFPQNACLKPTQAGTALENLVASLALLAKKFCERLHRLDVRAENFESGQDRDS
jgi:hypothetical protein